MKSSKKFVTLFRPVGPEELFLITESKDKKFPPRLPEQPFFYPVLTKEYATKIAKKWNVPASGYGYVTQFKVRKDFLDKYPVHNAGGVAHQEYWIPADELEDFNKAIVGKIKCIEAFELWYVYILKCSDDTLYTGITNNLERRVYQHNEGKGAKYTRGRGPVALVKAFTAASKGEALKLEYHIKQLSREEKLNYVQE